jgi:hypothetical protein
MGSRIMTGAEQLGQALRPQTVGQQAVAPDAHEAPRHYVLQAADKLIGGPRRRLEAVLLL